MYNKHLLNSDMKNRVTESKRQEVNFFCLSLRKLKAPGSDFLSKKFMTRIDQKLYP